MFKETVITAVIFFNSFLTVLGRVTKIFLLIKYLYNIIILGVRVCSPFAADDISCSLTEICDETTKTCQCAEGLKRYNETSCIEVEKTEAHSTPNYSSLVDDQSGGSIVIGILIPIILVAIIMFGIYLSRKYHIVTWVRRKLNYRNENYDEFMIGQDLDDDEDDPPLR